LLNGSSLQTRWVHLSGPSWSEASSSGAVQFRTINGTYYANFSSTGQFVLRLTATDTVLTNNDEVAVTVYDAPNPPEVAAVWIFFHSRDVTHLCRGTTIDRLFPSG
jgi:hypothetical protein